MIKHIEDFKLYDILSDYFCIVETSQEIHIRLCDDKMVGVPGKEDEIPAKCDNCGKVYAFDDGVMNYVDDELAIRDI